MANILSESAKPEVCPVCGDRPGGYVKKDGYDFWRSPKCGLLFVWPYLAGPPQEIYQAGYFEGGAEVFGYVDYDLEKASLDGLFAKTLARLESILGSKGDLLDVGAATGYFVGRALTAGWRASGIDVSAHGVSVALSKSLRVERSTLEEYSAPAGSLDVITMWDVLEHLPDPISALRKCQTLLRDGGALVINTPDGRSLWARLFGTRWHSLVPPEHIFIFNRDALNIVLRNSGFEVIEATNPVKKFTLPYILNMFSRWTGLPIPGFMRKVLSSRFFSALAIPLPLRDNVLVLAKKSAADIRI